MHYQSVVRGILHLKINPVVKMLIVADFLFWTVSNLIQPLFALFIVGQIRGATELTVGFAMTIYLLARVLPEIPVGLWLDRTKSQRDDHLVLVAGLFIEGVLYYFFPHLTEIWQLYTLQILLGLTAALNYPAWRAIFTRYADKEKIAFEWSVYDVFTGVGMALAASLGALFVARWGFDALFYIVGTGILVSAWLTLSVRRYIQ